MTASAALTIDTTQTDRGYTGQESLDAVALVEYNARLYDPALGRFLSVDPLIAHPGSTQSINPYSYVENNPLNKTDPTGMADCPGGDQASCSAKITNTPTGSHIPQTTTITKGANGKVTTSGAGAMPGGRIATSTSGSSFLQVSTRSGAGQGQGATSFNAGHNNIGKHDVTNNASSSAGGNSAAGDSLPPVPPVPSFDTKNLFANVCLSSSCGWFP